nr:response regulator [Anaerolineae bacterium]
MANLLVVDDEVALLEALQQIFEDEGHQVQAFLSAKAALDYLNANSENVPDVIVTDVIMPGMTGVQLLEGVRAHPEWRHIPFLFISATLVLQEEGRIASIPNVQFLRKPFDVGDLCDRVVELSNK